MHIFFFPVRDMDMIKVLWLMASTVRLCRRLHTLPSGLNLILHFLLTDISPFYLHSIQKYYLLEVSHCISDLGLYLFSWLYFLEHSDENKKVVINGS